MEQKRNTSPTLKVVFVKTQTIICQSVTGGFTVSDSNVEKGDDSVWGENPGW